MMNLDLTQKRALVCGSSRGIGRAIARELADQGASVTLLGRNERALAEVEATLTQNGAQEHHILLADFSDTDALKAVLDVYLDSGPIVHILINNTGGPPPGPAHQATILDFTNAFQQHLICNHLLVQGVLPGMKQAHYGRIINIASTSVKQPIPNLGVSNTIRGAVANWAKTLANELGGFGITVNTILPGATATDRLRAIFEAKAAKRGVSLEAIEEEEQAKIPLQRFGDPSELANVVAFLASPAGSYVSGVNLPVDGGRTRCG